MCPFQAFSSETELEGHVAEGHTAVTGFVASGRKQLNVVQAAFDDARIRSYYSFEVAPLTEARLEQKRVSAVFSDFRPRARRSRGL